MDRLGVGARLKMVETSADFRQNSFRPRPSFNNRQALAQTLRNVTRNVLVKQKALMIKRFVSHEPAAFRRYFEDFRRITEEHGIQVSTVIVLTLVDDLSAGLGHLEHRRNRLQDCHGRRQVSHDP